MLSNISALQRLCSRRYRAPNPLRRPSKKARVVLWWKTAVKRISRLLARRRAWAAEGLALQARRIQSLVEGLERKKGVLVRVTKLQSLRNLR